MYKYVMLIHIKFYIIIYYYENIRDTEIQYQQ